MILKLKLFVRGAVVGVVKAGLAVLPARLRAVVAEEAPLTGRMDYAKRDIFLRINSEFEYRIRLHSCSREPGTVRWIEDDFRDGDVFYDIGANVGAYSLVAAKLHGGRVRVVAFEPSSLNFWQLVRNIALNDCTAIVTPLQVALTDVAGLVMFNYRSLTPGGALHSLGGTVDDHGRSFAPAAQHQVLAFGLDEMIVRFNLPMPSHIKMDVDGGEQRILAGAHQTLGSAGLRTVLVEAAAGAADTLTAMLVEHGFELQASSPLEGDAANLLFARKAK